MSVGSRIKELRLTKGLTRKELASAIGVSVAAISNYENEISSPKEPILFNIIECFECDANYIFQDVIRMKNTTYKHTAPNSRLSTDEQRLLDDYKELNDEGKEYMHQQVFMAKRIYKNDTSISSMGNVEQVMGR